jgi:hypothetical protein
VTTATTARRRGARVPLAVPLAGYLARAAWLPRRALTPKQVGVIEIAASALLLASVPAVL